MKNNRKNKIRIVSATSLFDGHDASINIMRRVMQDAGARLIHLGHNRSVREIVLAAIQEGVQAIAVTSYQGGHIEFFKYMYDEIKRLSPVPVKIFGGGGGVILEDEIKELEDYGISKIFSPEDGRRMGLSGMIDYLMEQSDFDPLDYKQSKTINLQNTFDESSHYLLSNSLGIIEKENLENNSKQIAENNSNIPVLGVTGPGGAGKSSFIDELISRFNSLYENLKIAVLAFDPAKSRSGGALLGDRMRFNSIYKGNVFFRSVASTNKSDTDICILSESINLFQQNNFDLIIVETPGIGQGDSYIRKIADLSIYVMTPEYGAASQLEKIDMLDYADIIAINKFEKSGGEDALKAVKKQYRRNLYAHKDEAFVKALREEELPVFGTVSSRFNDGGVNRLFLHLLNLLKKNYTFPGEDKDFVFKSSLDSQILPARRKRYLSEIAESIEDYNKQTKIQADVAGKIQSLRQATELAKNNKEAVKELEKQIKLWEEKLQPENKKLLENWKSLRENYTKDIYSYKVRDREFRIELFTKSLSGSKIPKVSLPSFSGHKDLLHFLRQENLPGFFPFTSGIFPFKREAEDPTRMFAGEGGPEKTNRRFHFLSKHQEAKRLSTAFDSVTLYGQDPDERPDIMGKIGNSGVSVCTLDDMKKLYSGFHLCSPSTSVSMTINGPAPIMLAFFLNTAIDQECELYLKKEGRLEEVRKLVEKKYNEKSVQLPEYRGEIPEGNNTLGLALLGAHPEDYMEKEVYEKIKSETLNKVRGTIQADILKEDQAQNTCIFSSAFALKLMGDIQHYFIRNEIRNFYSVSISGYHIAEAGANPITQLAFTLANGFTYLEYYLARGMDINDFAPNFSFFFSNGLDPEYTVIGRVARRIWAKALKYKYAANKRAQMLKYHIQTSGRSLHAKEIAFNDIRTTLQALIAVYDNCNSLHTNAYDEAITTPTEESVRRALAIQLIINKEFGMTKNQNPVQGAFFVSELTDLVEEAVLAEFHRISDRGGVLGAMENGYQRNKIQDESLYYEEQKESGEYPIVGINTFLASGPDKDDAPPEVSRSDEEEKKQQINSLKNFQKFNADLSLQKLDEFKKALLKNENSFEQLMELVKYASLGQITGALYEVGGEYRRNI